MAVLVAYASAHGSTRGIAERIAERLRERGFRADVRSADEVDDVRGYEAVVIGSAIHGGAWLPGAAELVRRHRDALARLPVWLFSVGMVGEGGSAVGARATRLFRHLGTEPREVASLRETFQPRGHRTFVGAVHRGDWPWLGHVVFKSIGGHYGDHRSWDEIDAWALDIADQLGPAEPEAPERRLEW